MEAKYIIKISILGCTMVGKTSIVLRFSEDKFDNNQLTTIGINFITKYIKVADSSVKVLIWDAVQDNIQNISKQYYKGANGVLLIYDIGNRKSFERIDFWLKELKENNRKDELLICLVGNKIDLEDKRVITTEEGENYAKNNNILFFEVSAKTGKGVIELFNKVIGQIMDKVFEKEEGEDKVRLSSFLEKGDCREKSKRRCF